ncbi:MAG: protein tyrosine kinase [Acidobacteria bacterium]|nr:MAG: protein tyrosine kinase [Acidobacteriota bacterium]
MSRIHEALKRAEEQRPPSWKPAEPTPLRFGGERLAPGVLQPSLQQEMPTARRCLGLEELRRRCLKPGWKLNADYDVFSTKQSSALCAEEFRTLRSRLYRLREKSPIRTLLVTSTLPGEGKTFVALNLALAIARQPERRALVIDADLRASRLHVRLGAPSAPGLSDYLNGRADEYSIIQADPKVELFLVPAGRPVHNPSELLGNGLLRDFLHGMSPIFDWVIVDAPPVLALADAGIVAEFCDGVIVVVRAGQTSHDLVKTTLQEFRGINLLGVVLNGANLEANYSSYSGYAGVGMDKK